MMRFLFMTKVMPRTPVGTEQQKPIVLTIRYDINNKKQSYQPSRCFIHSGIKTLFMKDINLKAIINILTKKARLFSMGMHMFQYCTIFLKQWWCLLWGCWLIRSWPGWRTIGTVGAGAEGCPMPHIQVAPAKCHHWPPSPVGCRYRQSFDPKENSFWSWGKS